VLFILFIFLGLFATGQQEGVKYLPNVAWRTNVDSVIMLNTDTFKVKVNPIDYNEPGAINRTIGNYLKDYIGHTYKVIDSTSTTITVVDVFGTGVGPQQDRDGIVYRSVGNGESPYLAPVYYRHLDKSALDYSRRIELAVLWENKGLLDSSFVTITADTLFIGSDTIINNIIADYDTTGFRITESQISDLGDYLTDEIDPVYATDSAKIIWFQDTISIIATKYDIDTLSFLRSYTETDPVFSVSPAGGITTEDLGNWSTAYNWGDHSLIGYLTEGDNWGDDAVNTDITLTGDGTSGDVLKVDTTVISSLVQMRSDISDSIAGVGDVFGPASSTDNAIARFDGTGGKTIQNSGIIINDNNQISHTQNKASGYLYDMNNTNSAGWGMRIMAGNTDDHAPLFIMNYIGGSSLFSVRGNGNIYAPSLSTAVTDYNLYWNAADGKITYGAAGEGGGGATTFLGLTDTPSSYSSQAGKFIKVNSGETALEFTTAPGGSSPLTTKGDIFTYSTTDARLPVGTNGQVLSANSSETTGLEWISTNWSKWTSDTYGVTYSNNVGIGVATSSATKLYTKGTISGGYAGVFENNNTNGNGLSVRADGTNATNIILALYKSTTPKVQFTVDGIMGVVSNGSHPAAPSSGTGLFYVYDNKPYFRNNTSYYDLTATGGGGGSPLTTKGDLYTYSTTDARLGVGSAGQYVTPDASAATGLKWTALPVATTSNLGLVRLSTSSGLSMSGDYIYANSNQLSAATPASNDLIGFYDVTASGERKATVGDILSIGVSNIWTADTYGINYQAGNVGIGASSNQYLGLLVDAGVNYGVMGKGTGIDFAADGSGNINIKGKSAYTQVPASGYGMIWVNSSTNKPYFTDPAENNFDLTKAYSVNSGAPASAGATGTAGEIRYDANYIYICVATNTWKRANISTW